MTLRLRISLAVAVVACVLCGCAGFAFDAYLASATRATLAHALQRRAGRVEMALAQRSFDLTAPGKSVIPAADEAVIQVVVDGSLRYTTVAAGRVDLVSPTRVAHTVGTGVWLRRSLPQWHSPHLLLAEAVTATPGEVVVVGGSLDQVDDSLRRVRYALLLGGAIAVVLATIGSWVLARRALRPVDELRAQAEQMCQGPPDDYLQIPRTRDELAALAATLNGLLERSRASAEHQRRFVSAASHELRTPLAGMRAELERIAEPSRQRAEVDEGLGRLAGRVDQLTRITEGLLLIALGQEATLLVRRRHQSLEPIVIAALEDERASAEAAGVAIAFDSDAGVDVDIDADRIREVVDNLVGNAIRHAPHGSAVTVTLRSAEEGAILQVRDHGPGFGPDLLANAFEPFVRGGRTNRVEHQRCGLGLTLVRLIVVAHDGQVTLADHPAGGAVVTVRIGSRAALESPDIHHIERTKCPT